MANFLRDQIVVNISVNMDILKQTGTLFASQANTLNGNTEDVATTNKKVFISYIIRFDGKGYRVFDLEELFRYFEQANQIERIVFTLETDESLRSNRQNGSCMELTLDPKGSFLLVTSDNENWVDLSFFAIQGILTNCKTKSGWMRAPWTHLIIRIMGVATGFFISLWAAKQISPKLSIENPFIICFLFILLIFSNTWDYLNQKILSFMEKIFPNLKFYRPHKSTSHWLTQSIIGGIALAIVLWLLNFAFTYVDQIFNEMIQ